MAEWRKVDELFQAAAELPPDKRQPFLDVVCAGDSELRRQVEELLVADGRSTNALGAAVGAEASAVEGSPEDSWAGKRIGPYKLFRKLGEGGMGAVYLAGRVDDEYRQQVTIKLVKAGMDGAGILRRFRNERQILASLSHPNIARLIDGGTTESGQPYFVMEYIEGEAIDDYCDHHKLTIDERLELFCKICAAVQYAHQNLVVHRDLKPVNILVTQEREPKLLDFGIAKLLNPELAAQTVAPTGIDLAQPMTVPYASPEQVRGMPVTTVTDVYSLGVLLYELLTGHRPYQFANYLPLEVERVICDTEPEKPSTAVRREAESGDGKPLTANRVSALRSGRPEALRRRLSGDLDNIVLMAMRKEPQRRYASAEQLADDLRRHQAGRPVIARPATFGYRAGKFVRRNKLVVAFAASIVGFALAMAVQSVRLAEQRDLAVVERTRAEGEKARAERITEILEGIFVGADPFALKAPETWERLVKAAERVEEELADQPEIQARLLGTIGGALLGLGRFDDAQTWLEKALRIQEQLFDGDQLDLAGTLNALAAVLRSKNELERAEELFDRALTMRRRLFGAEHIDVAETMFNLGQLRMAKGDLDGAVELFRELLPMIRRLQGEDHHYVTLTLNNLAVVLHRQGDLEAAEPLYLEVLERYGRLEEPHAEEAKTLGNYGALLQSRGDHRGAEARYRKALELYGRLLGDDRHPAVAAVLKNLASLLVATGDYEGALARSREALDIYRDHLPPSHPRIAQAQSHLGAAYCGLGRFAAAEPLLLDSYRILGEQGEQSPYARTALSYLVDLYEAWGKPNEAARYQALLPESERD